MKIIKYPLFVLLAFLILLSCDKNNEEQEPEIERSYTKSVERISTNDFEAGLIDKAENYYPPRDTVVAATQWSGMELPDTKYWYYDHFDGVYLPFAVTSDAVDYYSELIDNFNKNKKEVFFLTAHFDYLAKVEFHEQYTSPEKNASGKTVTPDTYSKVYVVRMKLKWENYCGSLCALWINKERVVVFNETGDLIKVYLDGTAPVLVS